MILAFIVVILVPQKKTNLIDAKVVKKINLKINSFAKKCSTSTTVGILEEINKFS